MRNLNKMTKAELLNEAKSLGQRVIELESQTGEFKQTVTTLRENNLFLQAILDSVPFEVWACGADGRYALQNTLDMAYWGNNIGKSVDELEGWPKEVLTEWKEETQRALNGQQLGEESVRIVDQEKKYFSTYIGPVYQGDIYLGIVGVNYDVTDRYQAHKVIKLRLDLTEYAAKHSLEELLQRTLDEIGELTNSPIGFFHFVEADQQTLSLQAWSTRTLNEFCQAQGKGLHYPVDQAGVWADCIREGRPVIHNDYPSLSNRKGLPEGHAQVIRELVVPILKGDRIVAILGVGNKSQDYTERDVELVSYLADVAWEITDRKQVEDALQQANLVIENSPVVLFRWRAAEGWPVAMVSQNVTQFGYTSEELLSGTFPFASLVHPEDLERVVREVQEYSTNGADRFQQEYRIVTKDGGARWVDDRTVVERNKDGRITFYQGIVLDITERKRVEDALVERSQFIASLLRAIPVAVFFKDKEGRYVGCNDAFAEFMGVTAEEIRGKTVHELWPSELADKYHHMDLELMQNQEHQEYEFQVKAKNGQTHPVIFAKDVYCDKNGEVAGLVGAFLDITERKLAENEIRRLNEELEQRVVERTTQLEAANKELEAFSYSVSHDLRAPLRAIDGFSRILIEDHAPQLSNEVARLLGIVRDNTQQMGHLIDDLLAFSRLGRHPVDKQTIYTADLVRRVLDTLQNELEGREVEIAVGELPVCQGDPALLKQVWMNLLSNALKFTRMREVARIEIGCEEKDGKQVYFVKDNGVGFDMRYVEKLFGVFQRLHRSDKFEGTGVGLAIVQRIIHRHGGRVWVEAEPNVGASFYFMF